MEEVEEPDGLRHTEWHKKESVAEHSLTAPAAELESHEAREKNWMEGPVESCWELPRPGTERGGIHQRQALAGADGTIKREGNEFPFVSCVFRSFWRDIVKCYVSVQVTYLLDRNILVLLK